MRYIALALVYVSIGIFFCGLLEENERPGLLIIFWPVVFFGGIVLAFVNAAFAIGAKLRKAVKNR